MTSLVSLVETVAFARDIAAALDDDEIDELKIALANDPERGVVIPGTGGARKLRWAASGRGKRGGGRIVYYFYDRSAPVFLFRFFTKATKSDLSADEKVALSKVVEKIKAELKRRT